MAGTTETIDQAGGSAATQGDLWGERARDWADVLEGWNGWGILYRHILERVTVERGTGCSTWVVGRGDFASQPTGALTSRASMRRRRLFRSLGTASRRGNSVSGTSSISLAGQLVRRRHRLQLIHLCCQYHRCAA